MTKKKVDPVIEKAVKDLFRCMSEKDSVDNYPCLDTPCEYWWVRYATACTYLSHAQTQLWQPKLDEMQTKYNFEGYSYSGPWKSNTTDITDFSKVKLWVLSKKNKKETQVTNQCSELFSILSRIIEDQIGWFNCPYQMEHQSKCPFYKASQFYVNREKAAKLALIPIIDEKDDKVKQK